MNDKLAMQIRDAIKNHLIECRLENDLTQSDVGKVVGKSKNAVASWEQGYSLPDIATLYRLSVYYEKTINYMMGVPEDADR